MFCCVRVNVLWFLLLVFSGGLSITKNLFRPLVSPIALSWSGSSSVYLTAQDLRTCGYQPAADVRFILMELYGPTWGCSSRHTHTVLSFHSFRGKDHEDLHGKFSQWMKHLAKRCPWSCNFSWRNESWFITPQHFPTAVMHIPQSNVCKIFHFLKERHRFPFCCYAVPVSRQTNVS